MRAIKTMAYQLYLALTKKFFKFFKINSEFNFYLTSLKCLYIF